MRTTCDWRGPGYYAPRSYATYNGTVVEMLPCRSIDSARARRLSAAWYDTRDDAIRQCHSTAPSEFSSWWTVEDQKTKDERDRLYSAWQASGSKEKSFQRWLDNRKASA